MKVPAFWLSLGLTAGIILNRFFPFVPSPLLWAMVLAGLPFLWRWRGRRFFLPLLVVLFTIFGVLHGREDAKRPANAVEIFAGGSERVFIDGIVAGEPAVKQKGKRRTLSLTVETGKLMGGKPGNVFKHEPVQGRVQVFLYQPAVIPDVGDEVRAFGTLEKPRPALNPGVLDYRNYLAQKNIYAVLRGGGSRSVRIITVGKRYGFWRMLARIREMLVREMDRVFEPEPSEFFKALILGTRSGIAQQWQDAFMKTGTSHLLAISGLNIVLVAGSLYVLLLLLRVPQKAAAGVALITAVIYVLISGLGIPVKRAGYMTGGALAALLLDRERHSLNLFFIAFFLMLLTDPKCLADVSFQLSFLCVGSLLLLLPSMSLWKQGDAVFNQGLAVMAGTFPFVIYHFNIFSPIGLLTNMLAIPLFHLALLAALMTLAGLPVPGLVWLLARFSENLLYLGLFCIHEMAKPAWGYFYAMRPSVWHLMGYYGLLAAFLYFERVPAVTTRLVKRAVAVSWIFAALFFFIARPYPEWRLTLLSAGSNEIAHVQFDGGHHWLINAGRSKPNNQGERLVGPYLRSQVVRHLIGVLLTDNSKKHTGGLNGIVNGFRPEYIVYPKTRSAGVGLELPGEDAKNIRFVQTLSGDRIRVLGDGDFKSMDVLGVVKQRMILRVCFGRRHFIFLPEISAELIQELRRRVDIRSAGRTIFLILPAKIRFDALQMETLLHLLEPSAVTIPYAEDSTRLFFASRRYLLLSLDRCGALTFAERGGRLNVRSFLAGDISGKW